MVYLLILLTLILLLIILMFTVASKLIFSLDTKTADVHMTMLWLNPLLRSEITGEDDGFHMTVYLLGRRILTRKLKPANQKPGNKSAIERFKPTDIHVNTRFGFRDPFTTSLACSTIGVISQLFAVESLHEEPDFLAPSDYITLDGTAKLNLGRSLLKIK